MRIITEELMGYINVFEGVTKARVRGCHQCSNFLMFVVYEGEAGKAIGKGGENIKRVMSLLNKKIKVVEFNEDPVEFVLSIIAPVHAEVIFEDEKTLLIKGRGARFKQAVLGPERKNLKEIQSIVSDYFDVEIKVG